MLCVREKQYYTDIDTRHFDVPVEFAPCCLILLKSTFFYGLVVAGWGLYGILYAFMPGEVDIFLHLESNAGDVIHKPPPVRLHSMTSLYAFGSVEVIEKMLDFGMRVG